MSNILKGEAAMQTPPVASRPRRRAYQHRVRRRGLLLLIASGALVAVIHREPGAAVAETDQSDPPP